jgi:hypothetical protein
MLVYLNGKYNIADRPQAGKDYPKNYADFLGWFPNDAACLDYLDRLAQAVRFFLPYIF